MKHTILQPQYPDKWGIGQSKLAEIERESAEREMGATYFDAFATTYVPAEWRAMMRRRFYAARAQYETAKGALV